MTSTKLARSQFAESDMHTLPGHRETVKALNRKLKNVLFEETEPFLNEIMGVAMVPNE